MNLRRVVMFLVKLAIAAAVVFWIVRTIGQKEGIEGLGQRLSTLSWPWMGVRLIISGMVNAGVGINDAENA